MTDAEYTHLAFLLDRSGSMQSIKSATEEGFDGTSPDQAALRAARAATAAL